MATRFSDVMWLIEQIMWKSLDKVRFSFLLEDSIEETNELKITTKTIANHLGFQEVITECFDTFCEARQTYSRQITILDSKDWNTPRS